VMRLLIAGAFLAGVVCGCTGLAALGGHAQWSEPPPEIAAALAGAAAHFGVSERFLRCLSWEETRWQPWRTSAAGHMGLLQFSAGTWAFASTQAGWAGASPYDPWAAAEVAAWLGTHAEYGGWDHWSTAARCGSPWW
jgi:transglycosylase-like protein with SLT domain